MLFNQLHSITAKACACGKTHSFSSQIILGEGVLSQLPTVVRSFGASHVFLLSDQNTEAAAGAAVRQVLSEDGIAISSYTFTKSPLEPNEVNVGLAVMHYDPNAQLIIAVGSGVINDIGKLLSKTAGCPYIIVATAPSMDGYASATSSMTVDGLKSSVPSKQADVILGDLDILCQAPMKMMISGLGDMLAKFVSICEWRLSALITGEYFCPEIAELVRASLKACTDHADGLLKRDKAAVSAVMEGLILCGAAMQCAGLSRPASGMEHYLSHVWDMRGEEFGTPVETHGIQCAVGTLLTIRCYETLLTLQPDKKKALTHAASFSYDSWKEQLRRLLGRSAEAMIALEEKEQKYSPQLHEKRLEVILSNWDAIAAIIREELPSSADLEALMKTLGCPTTLEEIGQTAQEIPPVFQATRDIRDKYVLSRLCWDLGIDATDLL